MTENLRATLEEKDKQIAVFAESAEKSMSLSKGRTSRNFDKSTQVYPYESKTVEELNLKMSSKDELIAELTKKCEEMKKMNTDLQLKRVSDLEELSLMKSKYIKLLEK